MNEQSIRVEFGHESDKQLVASPSHYLDFMKGLVWEDMRGHLGSMLEDIKNECIKTKDIERIRFLQAEAEVVSIMLELPSFLLEQSRNQK